MAKLSPALQELIKAPNLGHLATLMPDGSPQLSPVWIDTDGTHILVNTAAGRQKPRNVERDGRVAMTIVDQTNPFRYAEIRGKVVKLTHEGAEEHIDRMAKKYLGVDTYPYRAPGERRVLMVIEPERIHTMGF